MMTKREKVIEIIKRLRKVYPHPHTALYYKTSFQLLIATILSAQATDKTVNTVTPDLFAKYKSAKDFADLKPEQLDIEIKKINFHLNKAKNIIAASKMIVERFNGKVPETMEELDSLPGVARKTANVVLGNAFGKAEGIAVDTHVMRLSQRLGLTAEKTPEKIEQDLMKIVPREDWTDFTHLIVNFGRDYCPARKHRCADCPLGNLCPDLEE